MFIGEGGLGGGDDLGFHRNAEESHHIDLTGEIVSSYGAFPGLEVFSGEGLLGRAPFGALLVTATHQDELIVGTGEDPELRVYGPEGALNRIVRWADHDRTVTEERIDEFVEFQLRQLPAGQANAMRDRLAGLPFPPDEPTHAEVIVSNDGEMLVGEYPGPEPELPRGRRLAPRRWVLFGQDGIMKERLETPVGFMPKALVDGLLWGVYYNELDVESVRAYRAGE